MALEANRMSTIENDLHEAMMVGQTDPIEMTLSIRLAGGEWLNVRTMFHRPGLQL